MNDFIMFFKEIFMISDESSKIKVGLSQFKSQKKEVKEITKKVPQKEIKLSDLMRRSA